MPRVCAYPRCFNQQKTNSKLVFHRLPLKNPQLLQLWLTAMNLQATKNLWSLRVCSQHFTDSDYSAGRHLSRKLLKCTAVPVAYLRGDQRNVVSDKDEDVKVAIKVEEMSPEIQMDKHASSTGSTAIIILSLTSPQETEADTKPPTYYAFPPTWSPPPLQDSWTTTDQKPVGLSSTGEPLTLSMECTGFQENPPEICAGTREKETPQHIVDVEAILQLLKNCPACDKKCRCTKLTRSPYLIIYQNCYFCNFHRRWASQPEAINIRVRCKPKRNFQSRDSVSVNATPQSFSHGTPEISCQTVC
ncbi:uncharacterized protein ACBR49_000930 [Aulostomus maculatus]